MHSPACRPLAQSPTALHGLQLARLQAQAQGLALRLQGCVQIKGAAGQGAQHVLSLRVQVVDSDVADAVVRGPLADGGEVDMGEVGPASTPAPQPQAVHVAPSAQPREALTAATAIRSHGAAVPKTAPTSAPLPAGEELADDDVSPDVVFNRQWLAQLMAAHGWQAVASHWWAFVPRRR